MRFLFFLLSVQTSVFAQDWYQINKEINNKLYLIRCLYNIEIEEISKKPQITFYSSDTKWTDLYTFERSFYSILDNDIDIVKVGDTTYDVENNPLKFDVDDLKKYSFNHLNYLVSDYVELSHNQLKCDFECRVSELHFYNEFSENLYVCNFCYKQNEKEIILRSLKAYYQNRLKTDHFSAIVDIKYSYYTHFSLQGYSISLMSENDVSIANRKLAIND